MSYKAFYAADPTLEEEKRSKTREKPTRIAQSYTRCPYCLQRLSFTDFDNPDEVIDYHANTRCPKRGSRHGESK